MTDSNAKPEVGKFYIWKDTIYSTKEYARECLYVNENGFLLGTHEKGIPTYFFRLDRFKDLVEYKPPVIHKAYLQWVRFNNGVIFARASSIKWNPKEFNINTKLLSETEVTYEEK